MAKRKPELKWKIPTRLDVLKDILSQYPDDGQILKEIIQNSEDAGAKHVKFIYDKHEYTKGRLDPKLAKFQGPALYAYNDAVFTDEDFANLLNIQHSSKREDRTKVGRFGRGFKSVFHMTEMPTLLSGEYFGRVNPYNDQEPCLSLQEVLDSDPAEFESFFGKFGFSEGSAKNGHYPGTIFRFPLRKEKSELSETVYGEDKVNELFRMLEADSHMNLLFLKSLVSIEAYVREVKDKASEGALKFSIKMTDISIGLHERLGFFSELGMATDEILEKECRLTYQVDFKKCIGIDRWDLKTFVVCHYYNGKKETQVKRKLLEDPNFSYLPLVSVAMQTGLSHDTDTEGQLFCFLPLPLHDNTSPTGLPIHVNSFFVVSSNRSEIKWPTTGQNVDNMTKDLQWNRCLITELLPRAYAHLLKDATALPNQCNVHPHDICSAFPNINRVNEKWKDTLLPPFLKQVHLLPIFPTSGTASTKYVCLKDAVLCPPSVAPGIRSALVKVLVDAGRNPVCVPEYMMTTVKAHISPSLVTEATPMFLCQLLKQCKKYHSYSREDKLQLLEYLLSKPDNTGDSLHNIQLLPLANQRFTEFDEDGTTIYVATKEERALLPSLQHKFLSDDLDSSLMERLTDEAVLDNTQLAILCEEDVLELLPELFPRLKSDTKILKLKPGKEPALCHLTADWCDRLWHFFTQISEDHPDHLDKVRHLHLLPIVNSPSDFHLTRLSGGAVCIAASLHSEALPPNVSQALPYFGVHILHEIPNVIRHHPFVFDEGFVYEPNALSVMQALMKIYESNTKICDQFNTSATNDQKRAFLVFLKPLGLVPTALNCKPFLRKLQLFETLDGSGHKPKHLVSLAAVPNGVTSYKIPVKPKCDLLDLSSLDTLMMAKFIGVNVMSETTIIENYILDDIRQRNFDAGDVRRIMLYVLNDLRVHTENSDTIMETLADLAFLEDELGHYRKPGDLFDPDDDVLKKLFAGENMFPSKYYSSRLESLRKLGLKKRSQVTVKDLNHTAALVHRDVQDLKVMGQIPGQKVTALKAKSHSIANIFLDNPSMQTKQKSRRLAELEWVPVQTDKPKSHPNKLPWNPEQKLFDKPGSIALDKSTYAIASSLAIVDSTIVPDKALETICGAQTPPCAKVVEHLRNLSQCYTTRDKPIFMAMVQAVYRVMEEYDFSMIEKELSEQSLTDWVWQGDGFTSVECVAISQQFNENLTPYAYTLPQELLTFHEWLLKMGVKQECNPVEVLHRIKNWHDDTRNTTEKANCDQPSVGPLLNIFRRIKDWHGGNRNSLADQINHDRSIAVNLINKIVEANPSGVPENIRQELVLPIEGSESHLTLLPASSCTYHDKEWKLGEVIDVEQVSQEDDETLHFLHRSISKATASALGVATLMNRLLEGDCEGFEFAAEFEGHGQEESLTHRLKHLLQDYPDGLAIPKELIQNADDAGATEIKFLFDERENEDALAGLLDEGMKQCQGPALWIYNNAEFSDEDLANIRKLSGATKEDKKDKIGKFGLGFNAVYNVTDVPSFVTREYVVFFDPHRSHLGKAMPRNDTGLKVNLCTGSKRVAEIRKQLFNQFRTYHNVFGCQMEKVGEQKPYPGTLFRLPLRKPGTVSEIKNVPYSREDMVELLQLLVDKADELLLFTQSVKQIEVYHLPMNVKDPKQSVKLYTAERNVLKKLKSLPSPPFPHTGERSNLLMVSKYMNPQMPQQYPNGLHVAERVITTLGINDENSCCIMGLHSRPRAVHWLLYGCFGLGKSFSMAVESSSEVPVAGVAVKLQPNGDACQPITVNSAPVYCHLPLPSSVKSGLPVIVNGCFAVKPDRRHLVELTSDDKQSAMNVWNEHLQEDAITEAYLGALELLTREVHIQGDPYCLWPVRRYTEKQFHTFHKSFFTCLMSKTGRWSPKIFTNGKIWVDFKHAAFLDKLLIDSELKEVALNRLQSHLDSCPGSLVAIDLPEELMIELGDLAQKTFVITEFFRQAVLPYIRNLDSQERDSLLLFGLRYTRNDTRLQELFQQNSCIPLRPDGIKFSKPCDLVSPTGQCAGMFDTEDGVFPKDNFCSKECLGFLEDMGMRVDNISWECIIGRAHSVQRLIFAKSIERTKHILAYIDRMYNHAQSKGVLDKLTPLRQVKFLPVMGRPYDYPQQLPWKGDSMGQTLVAAVDVYLPKHQRLIGSTCLLLDEQRSGLRMLRSRQFLERVLGLTEKTPKACDVITQLLSISEGGTNSLEIQSACTEIYRYLNSCCSGKNPDAKNTIFNRLADTKCVLVGDHFMYPLHCAIAFDKEVPPFISKVPYQMCQYKFLLAAIKVKQSFEPIDFIEALHRIGPGVDVCIVRGIAESLHKQLTEKDKSIKDVMEGCSKPVHVLLPSAPDEDTSTWELLPVSRLCLNLYPWLKKPVSDQSLRYVHTAITPEVAKALGVKTDGENIFEALGCQFGVPFGQKEKLTTRIRNILEGYPCDEGILKELLQNADDAGASELRFILDTGTHGGEKIFHQKWRDMQGPALCVFNNKHFTKDDLNGICSLGQGSKSSDTTKTGQYGIGFNCVYHLTDVPSFLTDVEGIGKTLCFFDPNCNHVPGATADNPGRSYQGDQLVQMRKIFPDMCQGYFEDRFHKLDGATMFRLPLRTAKVAESSDISNKEVTVRMVEHLMDEFKEELFYSLLFVNSVRRVYLEKIDETAEPYTVEAHLSDQDQAALWQFNKYVKLVATRLRDKRVELKDVKYRDVIYTLKISDSKGREETWSVCQCIGFKNADIPPVVANAVSLGDIALLPRGGVAYRIRDKPSHRLFCFLPLPVDTPLPVHVNGHFALDSSRRALWNDVKDKTSGYKQAWNTMLMEQVVSHAYISLVSQQCNQLSSTDDAKDLTSFYRMFPELHLAKGHFIQTLCKAFYTILKTNDLRFLAVKIPTKDKIESRWFSVKQCAQGQAFFDNTKRSTYHPVKEPLGYLGHRQHIGIGHWNTLGKILCEIGFNLLAEQVPRFIHDALLLVKASVPEVEPTRVLTFLESYKDNSSCKVKNLPLEAKQSPFHSISNVVRIVMYCFPGNGPPRCLQGLPLCITQDGILQEFPTKTDIFVPEFSSLLPKHPNKFLHADVFHAIPADVISASPRSVQQLSIEKIAPFLKTDYRELCVEYRRGWDPHNSESGLRRWIETLWSLIQEDLRDSADNRCDLMKRLASLKDFCVVPAKVLVSTHSPVTTRYREEYYLYPLKDVGCVVDTSTAASAHDQRIQEILRKVGVPIIGVSASRILQEVLKRLASNVRDASGILQALSSLLLHEQSAKQLVAITQDPSTSREIVKYLSCSLKDKCTQEDAKLFLTLPIHQIASGRVVSLQNSCVFLVPRGIPVAGLDNWYHIDARQIEKFIFIDDKDVTRMYKRMCCVEKTTVDLYVELILVKFNFQHFFDDFDRLAHLEYLRGEVLPYLQAKERNVILAALKELPFLQDSQGVFRCAKELYNPLEPLFKAMETLFPPRAFHSHAWIKFLAECGLHHTVTGQDLVRYAGLVAVEGNQPGEDTVTKAILICCKLNEFAGHSDQTLFQIKNIRFLPAGKVCQQLSNVHPQKTSNTYISFEGSAFYDEADHCWSVVKILPDWLHCTEIDRKLSFFQKLRRRTAKMIGQQATIDQSIAKTLGVLYPLPVDTVVAHYIRLVMSLSSDERSTQTTTKEMMGHMYEVLFERHKELSEKDIEKLTRAPVMVVDNGKHLVRPDQAVVTLKRQEAVEPYLFALPEQLFKYTELFLRIGVKMDVTYKHYMNVLHLIRDSCVQGKVEPNLLKAVEKATVCFFTKIEEADEIQQETGKLFLLSRRNTMELSSELVLVDKPSWDTSGRIERIDWPVFLLQETDRLQRLYDKHLQTLPSSFHPKLLSNIVEEDIDETCLDSAEDVDEKDTQQYTERISSNEFKDGLKRILLKEHSDQSQHFEEKWNKLADDLSNIRFHTVDKLQTILKIKQGEEYKLLENSDEHNDDGVFIKSFPDRKGASVYLEKGSVDVARDDQFIQRIVAIVEDVFPTMSDAMKNLLNWLFLWPKTEISYRLDKRDIRPLSYYTKKLEPSPGDQVPQLLHGILRLDIGTFEVGEIVGFKRGDPLKEGIEGEEEYVYAKVLSHEGGCGEDFQMYMIDIGDRQVVVFASNLYKFERRKLLSDEVVDDPNYDFEKVKAQIATDIGYAYQNLSAEERFTWMIRTISKWQPDNNPGHEDTCKQALKVIQEKIDEEESKIPEGALQGETAEAREARKSAANVRKVVEYTARRARENREHVQAQRIWLESNSKMANSLKDSANYDYFHFMKMVNDSRGTCRGNTPKLGSQSFYNHAYQQYKRQHTSYPRSRRTISSRPVQHVHVSSPRPHEARQWFRQAEEDLDASGNDVDNAKQAYEWAIFKCYKAAEKALKAAYFTMDSDNSSSEDLVNLASRVNDPELSSLAKRIAAITGDCSSLQYPAQGARQIPREQFGRNKYLTMNDLTQQLLRRVKRQFVSKAQ